MIAHQTGDAATGGLGTFDHRPWAQRSAKVKHLYSRSVDAFNLNEHGEFALTRGNLRIIHLRFTNSRSGEIRGSGLVASTEAKGSLGSLGGAAFFFCNQFTFVFINFGCNLLPNYSAINPRIDISANRLAFFLATSHVLKRQIVSRICRRKHNLRYAFLTRRAVFQAYPSFAPSNSVCSK